MFQHSINVIFKEWAQWRSKLTKDNGAKKKLGPQLNCLCVNKSHDINSYI